MYKDVAKNIDKFNMVYPTTYIPSPDEDDYNRGYIRRYFIRKSNDVNAPIFEIDQETTEKYIENPFWITANIRWRIRGPIGEIINSDGSIEDMGVRNSNREAIFFVKSILPNLIFYIPDLTQFHIERNS